MPPCAIDGRQPEAQVNRPWSCERLPVLDIRFLKDMVVLWFFYSEFVTLQGSNRDARSNEISVCDASVGGDLNARGDERQSLGA